MKYPLQTKVILSIVFLALAACEDRSLTLAPVIHIGGKSDSVGGAVMIADNDTVWKVSQRYNLPVRDIIELNGLTPPYGLSSGQRLKLPLPREHRVEERDTLYSISRMYKAPVSQLVKLNKLQAPYYLRAGQVMRLPSVYAEKKGSALIDDVPEGQNPAEHRKTTQNTMLERAVAQKKEPPDIAVVNNSSWPVKGKVISSYGPKEGGFYNEGINIAAPQGTPVKAFESGTVAYVGDSLESYGNLVLIRHASGIVTAYAHLAAISVKLGMKVQKGQVIGAVGSTGTVANSQLHFEIRKDGESVDPKKYLI